MMGNNYKKIAERIGVEIKNYDIQRAHRIGKKQPYGKLQQLFVRFKSYKK